ncbi:MAG: Fic family protein [Bacteroidales bacterium]|jgi:fido (protein-threonine AMPylation protein)/DNA-binding CsgD family transcriptional regulator|nr:Fic family protein [Bacteroidales bacterium]
MNDFEEYIRQGEPDKVEKSQIWQTAIGLQQVDGLTPSAYLIETAKENIEGKITIDEVKNRIDTYYKTLTIRNSDDDRTEEADKVSARIAEVLGEKTFTFSYIEFINIHKRLFSGTYKFAGKVRDYDISKNEWVLDGKSVMYASAYRLRDALEHDFNLEKSFDYKGLTPHETVEHIVKFISNIWQAHVFGEGNTRTTAVFAIKYLRTFGFEVENDMFAQHSWYFRNALVRANYNDTQNKIYATQEYLIRFFGNVIFGENNELKNRYLHIKFVEDVSGQKTMVRNGGQKNDSLNAGANAGVNAGVKLTETQKKIVSLIKKNAAISQAEIAKKLKVNETTIYRNIEKLKQLKILTRQGSDKKGHWQIKKTL